MNVSLKYIDEEDKSYGLVGTAVGMYVFECDDHLLGLSLDETEPERSVQLVAEHYFSGNPSMSAKIVWNNLLSQYRMMVAMTVSNYLCRVLVHRHDNSVDPFAKNMLRRVIIEEGHDTCQLDEDEIDRMFNQGYQHFQRIFAHSGVQNVIHTFASDLRRVRTMDHEEIERELMALRMI
ncbi:MAG: hypothetical protein K2O00_09305 [Muribaculaceae bacterium]|nr:hypothetical protein [Muribaculaceae bacterium]